ncbi:MAG: DUF5684 domain-containing protein [Candidatus Saccharibacteria bacterium]
MYESTYNSSVSSGDVAGGFALFAGGMMVFMLISILIAYAISSFLLSRIFKKAGVEGWIAWVPIYNMWTLFELGDQKGWLVLLNFVPIVQIVSLVYMYIAMYHIGRKFGKEDWFIALAIFLPIVWYIILAFDKSQWNGGMQSQTVNANVQPAYAPPIESAPTEQTVNPVEPVTDYSAEQPTVVTPSPEVENQTENTPPTSNSF